MSILQRIDLAAGGQTSWKLYTFSPQTQSGEKNFLYVRTTGVCLNKLRSRYCIETSGLTNAMYSNTTGVKV